MSRTQKVVFDSTDRSNLHQYQSDANENDDENDRDASTDARFKYWDLVDETSIGKLLAKEDRNIDRCDIFKRTKNIEAICLYRFASNYGGGKCNGLIYGGICLYHWQQTGVSFINVNSMVLDNVENGSSRMVTDRIVPYFINTHGKGTHCMAPIVRSIRYVDWCTDKEKLVSLISSAYTLVSNREEAAAMAKGLLTIVFGNSPDILTIRNSWLETQKQLARILDPNNAYQLVIQEEPDIVELPRTDDLSIYDSPMLLAFPASSVESKISRRVFANPANITMIQYVSKTENKTLGVFAIVGPVVYAPILKRLPVDDGANRRTSDDRYRKDLIFKQHLLVYATLSGITSTPKSALVPIKLSQSSVYVINISESKPFSNEYWDNLKCNSRMSTNFLSAASNNGLAEGQRLRGASTIAEEEMDDSVADENSSTTFSASALNNM